MYPAWRGGLIKYTLMFAVLDESLDELRTEDLMLDYAPATKGLVLS